MPVMKPCTVCGAPSAEARCSAHRRQQTQAREARRAPKRKGYVARHKALRKTWEPRVKQGGVHCRRGRDCLLWPATEILPDQAWHVGEPDAECDAPTAPEHERCNTSAAGRQNHG